MSWEIPRNGRASLGGRTAAIAVAAAFLAVLCGCEMLAGRTGGGTETETVGSIHNADGTPAARARVLFRPADYLADSLLASERPRRVLEGFTDDLGRFRILGLAQGAYRMEAEGGNGRGLIRDFVVDWEGQRVELASDTLRPLGAISGSFVLDSSRSLSRYVQIYGLERLVMADTDGSFMIPDLPPAEYSLRFQGRDPFLKQAVKHGVMVRSGEITRVEPVVLEEVAKLTYRVEGGALTIDGVGTDNPFIFDNELWDHGVENEYLWAKASQGRLDLRGNVVSIADSSTPTVDGQLALARKELLAAGQSGLANIPDPVAGSRRRLTPSSSGLIDDIEAERSEGSDLIVAEARAATPGRPLVVIAGGSLTTVANAYLTDPSIAPRMVVLAVYPFTINGYDTLATYVVAKRCRMVAWGRGYVWQGSMDPARVLALPGNRMAERARAYLLPYARAGMSLLGDIAPVAALFRSGAWTDAEMAKVSPPLTVTRASSLAFDFLDIPEAANTWPLFQDEFFGTLADTATYAATALPGRLEAEGYAARAGARGALTAPGSAPDTSVGDAMAGSAGAWLEFKVASAAGVRRVAVRYRAPEGGRLTLAWAGGPALADLPLPAGSGWAEAAADLTLPDGAGTLRATWSQGTFDLNWMEFRGL